MSGTVQLSDSEVKRETRLRKRPALTGTTIIGACTGLLFVVAAVSVDHFATTSNIRALLLSVSLTGIIAVGLSLITLVGRLFSLSVASTVALATIVFAHTLQFGAWPALILTTLFACGTGLIQGWIVGVLRSDPIITTIAFSAVLLGIGQEWTGGRTIVGHGSTSVFNKNLLGIPFQILAFVVVIVVVHLWQRYSAAGRKLSLIGLNENATRIVGVRAWPYIVIAFAVSGAVTGLAAGLLAAQSGEGNVLLGGTYGFDAIIAVVVGGVRVSGGIGSPFGAAVGALFVGLLGNMLALVGLNYQSQLVVKGAIVLAAVALTGLVTRIRGDQS